MSRFLRLNALLLAVFWLPATVHCRVESLGLSALFACATSEDSSHNSGCSGDDQDCAADACQSLEAGDFLFAKSRLEIAPLLAPICACQLCLFSAAPPPPAREISAFHQDESLPWQRTWQFVRRAAPSPRAPSLSV